MEQASQFYFTRTKLVRHLFGGLELKRRKRPRHRSHRTGVFYFTRTKLVRHLFGGLELKLISNTRYLLRCLFITFYFTRTKSRQKVKHSGQVELKLYYL
jgi:hypothetical protein